MDIMKCHAQAQPFRAGVDLFFYMNVEGVGLDVARPVEFERIPVDCSITRPTVQLRNQTAQQLMDELWHCGFRPSEGSGSAGSLAATERHLADMRRLVFESNKEARVSAN